MIVLEKKIAKKSKLEGNKIKVLTRHPSYKLLKDSLPRVAFRSVVRFGSTTDVPETLAKNGDIIELNTIEGVKNSSSKILMKKCFAFAKVPTANWFLLENVNNHKNFINMSEVTENPIIVDISNLPYPIVAKHEFGSRNSGNYKLDNQKTLEVFLQKRQEDLHHFLFEKFYNMSREYRIHVTEDGYFYTCRKMLKTEIPVEKRWIRNDSTCIWIVEDNPQFDKPVNWDNIVKSCVSAAEILNLQICAFDVKVQSASDKEGNKRTDPEYILLESCSAPSMGDITTEKYLEEIPKLLTKIAKKYALIK